VIGGDDLLAGSGGCRRTSRAGTYDGSTGWSRGCALARCSSSPGPNPITQLGRSFGGIGLSGFGREGGKAGIDEFLMVKGVGIGRA